MNIIEKVKNEINLEINQALLRLKEKGLLSFNSVPDFALEVPREKSHGDFATNIAMLLTKEAKKIARSSLKKFARNAIAPISVLTSF